MTTLINRSWTAPGSARSANHRARNRPASAVRTVRVGLLGCGTIGSEVAAQLVASKDRWLNSDNVRIELSGILVRDSERDRGLDSALLTTRIGDILRAQPDVIIEAIGGVDPACAFVEAALRRGIPVVTANKTLMAHQGDRLRLIAAHHDTALFCEACVSGAVPIMAALKQFRGDRIRSIRGIVNGTCNDILSRMADQRLSFDESLQQAVDNGLAEPDPTSDITGRDSAEKLCVLAAAAGFSGFMPDQVETTGIQSITRADIEAAKSHGYVIKLIAELAVHADDSIHARVGPVLVPRPDVFARAVGPENVIVVECELAGSLTIRGAGAGPKPTASAILGDVRRAIDGERGTIPFLAGTATAASHLVKIPHDLPRCQYVRIALTNDLTPTDVLSAFASHGVEVRNVHVRRNAIEIFTGVTKQASLISACGAIDAHANLFISDVME